MRDNVHILIGDKEIRHFISYSIESDIFNAADAFSFELADPETEIQEGQLCKVFVNEQLELIGITDRITESYDKSGRKLKIEGRDLMGVLVDSYCEEGCTLEKIDLKALAQHLLKNVPFINTKSIEYGRQDMGKAVPLKHKKEEHDFVQIHIGDTIFETLRNYATSRGMVFFNTPDGRFFFGQPKTSGDITTARFFLNNRLDGLKNNIIHGERTRDISKRYSVVKITGDQQGSDAMSPAEIVFEGKAEDKTEPFYKNGKEVFHKPLVASMEHDGQDANKYARLLLEKQRFEGCQLSYKTNGHSQDDKNYQINELCQVTDEVLKVSRTLLIYARTFEMSKESGLITTLKLSELGVMPS